MPPRDDDKNYNGSEHIRDERLLRVEDTVSDLNERVTRVEVVVETLPKQIDSIVDRVGEKIDNAVEPVGRAVAEVTSRHNALAEAVAKHAPVIDEFIQRQETRKQRADIWRKAMWTILSGAVAIIGKELMMVVIHALSH